MATLGKLSHLRMGLHSGPFNFDAVGAESLKYVAPAGAQIVTDFEPDDRSDYETGDGEAFHALPGERVTELNGLQVPLLGVQGGIPPGADKDVSAMDIGASILTSVCGMQPTARRGETTHAAAAGDGNTIILTGAPTNLVEGDGILVKGVSGRYHARYIKELDGATITPCRPLVDEAGDVEAVALEEPVLAGLTWRAAADNPDHDHLFADGQDLVGRRRLYGLLANAQLQIERGRHLRLVTSLGGTTWDDPARQTDPALAYDPPDAGSHIQVLSSPFYRGSKLEMAHGFSWDFGLEVEEREAYEAPAGHWGFVSHFGEPTLALQLHYGGADRETDDDELVNELQSGTTQDLLVQWGRAAGGWASLWIPAAETRARIQRDGAQKKIAVTAIARRSPFGLFRFTVG